MARWIGMVGAGAVGALLVVALTAAAPRDRAARFETIEVERINLREPDGRLRLVISNQARFPGAFHKNRDVPHPSRNSFAGMLFMNDEGTENGGLIWNGKKGPDGISSGASLTFDRYEQDKTMQLLQTDSGRNDMAAMIISDRPDTPLNFANLGKPPAEGQYTGAPRLFVGKSQDRNAIVMMNDRNGMPRLMLKVTPEGEASIDFLDPKGKVVRSIGAS